MKKLIAFALVAVLAAGAISSQPLLIYTEDAPPYNFVGPDGNMTGMVYEIVVEIQKRVGNTDKIQLVPWARGLYELDSKPNVLLFATNRTGERNPKYQWIGPVAENQMAFYSKASAKVKIATLEDAKKVAYVGVYLNDVRDQLLTGMKFLNLDKSVDAITPVKKLMAGRVNLIASSPNEIGLLLKDAGFKSDEVTMQFVFQRTQMYIAASKDLSPSVVKAWNDAFASMRKDGSFEKIHRKYLPDSPLPGPAITTF